MRQSLDVSRTLFKQVDATPYPRLLQMLVLDVTS
jgi:hypothetical protein